MNEENAKLARVQKSCKAAGIISRVFFIVCAVGCVIALITCIVMITNQDKFNEEFAQAEAAGKTGAQLQMNAGPFVIGNVDYGTVEKLMSDEMHSSVPALQSYFDEHKGPALVMGGYLMFIGVMCGITAFAFWLFMSMFNTIIKEGNPFADAVIKKMLICMILISVVITFTAGWGFGAVGGFLTWVVYTVMDYGRVLRIQSEETL